MAFDQNAVLRVEVVSADAMVWEGNATSVTARTVEGDIGILINHEALLAALVPCAAEITTTSGERKVFALDGGFMSVEDNRVALISRFARPADGLSVDRAQQKVATAREEIDGEPTDDQSARLDRALGELRAAQKATGQH